MKTQSTTTRRKTGTDRTAPRTIPESAPPHAPPIRISVSIRPPALSEPDRLALALGRMFYERLAQNGGDYGEAAEMIAGVARSIDRLAPGETRQPKRQARAARGRQRAGKAKP